MHVLKIIAIQQNGIIVHILPVEIIYWILDNLDEKALFLSIRNVCQRLNTIIDSYRSYQTLTTFELFNEPIGVEGAQRLAQVLALTTLGLWDNGIGVEGIKYLAQAFEKNKTLTTLYLECNRIGADGAQYLAQALEKNMALTTLSLDDNEISANNRIKNVIFHFWNILVPLFVFHLLQKWLLSRESKYNELVQNYMLKKLQNVMDL